jgi:hypothetical protein
MKTLSVGACAADDKHDECLVFEEGDACSVVKPETGSFEPGVCANGSCEALWKNNGDRDPQAAGA